MSTTAQRPSVKTAIQKAASSTTPTGSARGGCADCVKSGLAILPVIPLPLPNDLRGANAEFGALDGGLNANDLKAHWYAMRSLPAGFLYVLRPDLSWDAYLVDRDGLFRRMPVGELPANAASQAPMSEICKRHGDNIPAQVIAIDPTKHAAVWMAFSRYRWTPAVLRAYATNKDGCRDKRMTKLDVMAAAAGSLGKGSKVAFGTAMSAQAINWVADYVSSTTRGLINNRITTPLAARGGQGAALAAKMAEISKETQTKTGAIILLDDNLGTAQQINAMRNAETGKLAVYLAQNQRKRFIGEVILGFEKSFTENGQTGEWNKRYKPKYQAEQITADRLAYDKKVEPWKQKINTMSDDVAVVNAPAMLSAWWHDFDPQDDQSAKDRQMATAACLHGAVRTAAEEQLWDAWFQEDPRDKTSTLWGAATALNPSLADYLLGKELPDVGKIDKFTDVAKNLREIKTRFADDLAKRTENEAMAVIGTAMASQVTRVRLANPSLYRVVGWRVLAIVTARTQVTVAPAFLAANQQQITLMLAEAAFGPPQAGAKRLLDLEVQSSRKVYVVGTNGVDAYAFAATQTTTERVRVMELWLPEELAKDIPAFPISAKFSTLPPPTANPFKALVSFSKSLPGGFAWAGFLLQSMNLANSAKDAVDSKVSDKTDAYFGIASGILGVTGVTVEIAAGAMEKMAGRFAATRIAQVAFLGGALAGASAFAEAIQLFIKGVQRIKKGDGDAATNYFGSSVAFALSGIAAVAGSLAIANAAGALTGALSFLAGAGSAAAVIPVWGWIAASILFLGAGMVILWQAIKDTDTPLETWLLGSSYGTGSKKLSVKDEMDGINDVMYAMSIEVEWISHSGLIARASGSANFYSAYDGFKFNISLPGAGADSVIDCKVTLIGSAGRKEVFHETIRPRMLGKSVTDPHMAVISSAPSNPSQIVQNPSFLWTTPPRIETGGRSYGGRMKIDDNQYQKAQIDIQYWPDQRSMPGFVLPKTLDQRTLTDSK
ncbi:T6SS effector BTH_I2691 family protein [Pseudorhodoferax sp.]|uniref:T6SS effector BTH_I2691 family protein n=1 Tax=Pseudorhodoferax sp. TaxID=1993553 RepID=UPI0039E546CF